MKSFLLVSLGLAISNSIFSQKIANTEYLEKYDHYNLYEEKALVDLSGTWTGEEIQYDKTNTFIVGKFIYEFDIKQDGNKITGTSFIQDPDGNFSKMNLRGFVIGQKFHFEEYEITNEVIKENTVWCFTTGELAISSSANKLSLTGDLEGYSSDNYRKCDDATVTLSKTSTTTAVLDNISDAISVSTYPNPFNEKVTLSYTLPKKADVLLEVFDLSGKKIATVVNKEQTANTYINELSRNDFTNTSGIYLAKLTIDGKVYTKQFVQAK